MLLDACGACPQAGSTEGTFLSLGASPLSSAPPISRHPGHSHKWAEPQTRPGGDISELRNLPYPGWVGSWAPGLAQG